MRLRGWFLAALLLGVTQIAWTDEPQKGDPPQAKKPAEQPKAEQPKKEQPKTAKLEPIQVPYRLTNTQHILVRVKINGKGPFNFIVDTGAPIMILSTDMGKKLGLETNKFVKLDRVEIEGGAVLEKFPCLIETPFQLEGMNGLGMAGRELHGLLGYTVLAKFRMEIDFTRDKMTWTPLDYTPPPPKSVAGDKEAKASQGGLEMLGTLMKFMGMLSGGKKTETVVRGFMGIQLNSDKDKVSITAVLGKSPADLAGLKAGDQIIEINKKKVSSLGDAHRLTAEAAAGKELQLLIRRDGKTETFKLMMGDGL